MGERGDLAGADWAAASPRRSMAATPSAAYPRHQHSQLQAGAILPGKYALSILYLPHITPTPLAGIATCETRGVAVMDRRDSAISWQRHGGLARAERAADGTWVVGLGRWWWSAGRVVDVMIALLAGLLTVQTRRPFKLRMPYAWDSILYIRALDHFDPTIHQPQPPGYLLYVATGRLLMLQIGDPNRALVWVSIFASGVAVAALYLLVRLLYDRATALVAAALLLTAVTFWFYGEVAYPYTVLAAGSTVLAALALALRRGHLPGAYGAALFTFSYGLLAGFRQDLLLFLAPLALAALWGRPWRHWLLGVVVGGFGILLWLIPTAMLSGGLPAYLRATLYQGAAASGEASPLTHGLAGLVHNARTLAIFLWHGLYFTLLPLGYHVLRRLAPRRPRDPALPWVLLWLTPPLAYYLLGHLGDHGYTLSLLPALLTLAARGVVLAAGDLRTLGSAVWRYCAGQTRLPGFFRHARILPLSLLLGAVVAGADAGIFLRSGTQFSVAGIACFDTTMRARLVRTRALFQPGETLIFAAGYYQHARTYLSAYRVWLFAPDNPASRKRVIPAGIRHLLIFDEEARPAAGQVGFAHFTLPCNGVPFWYAAVRAGDVVRYDPMTATITINGQRPPDRTSSVRSTAFTAQQQVQQGYPHPRGWLC